MTYKPINEAALAQVVAALAQNKCFEGDASPFQPAFQAQLQAFKREGVIPFHVLGVAHIVEELTDLIVADGAPLHVLAHTEQVKDLYLNYAVYEETMNAIVEEVNGGVCSYDHTQRILEAYERTLRAPIHEVGTLFASPIPIWLDACTGIFEARTQMDATRFQTAKASLLAAGLKRNTN